MADSSSQGSAVTVPDEIRSKFPDLVELVLASESMNDEERQYWINIIPIMTPEQLNNLRDILETEKKQLAEIDEKYSTEETDTAKEDIQKTEEERRKRREQRQEKEMTAEEKEEQQTKDLLEKIEQL